MIPTLRPHQVKGKLEILDQFLFGHKSVLYVLPTGGGKTILFSHIAQHAALENLRVLILVHRVELLRQASMSLRNLGMFHGLISAGCRLDLSESIQVASVQTVGRRLNKIPKDWFDLLIVDEAHHSVAGTWAKVLDHFSGANILGVTATPCRTDGQGLKEYYTSLVVGPSPKELTDSGFLATSKIFSPPGISLTGLRKVMGEFDMKQASKLLEDGQAMGGVLKHYKKHLNGNTAIAFCCSIHHAKSVAQMFNDAGIPASIIDGEMSPDQREQLLRDLASGKLKVLTSCDLIGEGVDVPSVGGCIILRPTESLILHLQMIGRCLRPHAGKNEAIVIDHVGNCLRHGLPTDFRRWSLDGVSKDADDEEDTPLKYKVCPECSAILENNAETCSHCGHNFSKLPRFLEHVEGDLEIINQQIWQEKLTDLIKVGKMRKLPDPEKWAKQVMIAMRVKGLINHEKNQMAMYNPITGSHV